MERQAHRLRFSVLALSVALPACSAVDRSVAISQAVVLPVTVGDAADVPAAVLAEAMLRAGFSNDEVMKNGAAVHDALATSGGAQVRQGQIVAAMFAIHSNEMYVTSRTRGTFVQPLVDDGADPLPQ